MISIITWRSIRALALLTGALATAGAAEFYVSPSGSTSGTGTIASPWNLATALSHPAAVRPGDTIWVRGGTYRGNFMCTLTGTATAPITVRRYADERVIIDGNGYPMGTLTIQGAYTRYWGFEVMNSNTTRSVVNYQACYPNCRPSAVEVFGRGTKIINMVIHDSGAGIGLWQPAIDAEAYGNLIFYNGWESSLRGHGHGIYTQNNTGTKRIVDNMIFNQFHTGINAYGSSTASIRNYHIEGNVIFNNGLLASDSNGWGILVGGSNLAQNVTLLNNYLYNPTTYTRSSNIEPSYGSGTSVLNMSNNYSVGYRAIEYRVTPTGVTAAGNSFYGLAGTLAAQQISATTNTFASVAPAQNRVYVRRNQYEPDYANIVVFNGTRATTASVNVSSVLLSGDRYEIRDVQNYLNAPLMTGTYTGAAISIPMTATAVSLAAGALPRAAVHTGVEFGAFVLRKRSAVAPAPLPVPAPKPAPTPPPPPPSASTIYIEAETGVVVAPMSITASPAASGGRFVSSSMPNLGSVEMTFTVPAAGVYAVWASVVAAYSGTDSFFVSVDGGPEAIFDTAEGTWSPNLQWSHLCQRVGAVPTVWNLTLTAGQHRLRFRAREAMSVLDRVLVTNNLSFTPTTQ